MVFCDQAGETGLIVQQIDSACWGVGEASPQFPHPYPVELPRRRGRYVICMSGGLGGGSRDASSYPDHE